MGNSDHGLPERDHGPDDDTARVVPAADESPDGSTERRSELIRGAADLKRKGDVAFDEGLWARAVECYILAKQIYETLGNGVLVDEIDRKLRRTAVSSRRRCRAHHRVLVVEDDQHWRTLVGTHLKLDGDGHFQDVRYVVNAFDAIEALGPPDGADDAKPDVILLDLHLPDMSGIEALSLIRKGAPHAKVVVITAFAAGAFRTVARERGASRYLEKGEIKNFAATLRDICCV